MRLAMGRGVDQNYKRLTINRWVLALLGAVFAPLGGCGGDGGGAAGDSATGDATAEAVAAARDMLREPEIGEPLPDVALLTTDGGEATLWDYRDQVVLLNLWATWCIPCLDEMPELQEMSQHYPQDEFTVLGVSIEAGPPELVTSFADELGVTYPIFLAGELDVLEALDLDPAVPQTILLDRAGRVQGYWSGRFHPFEDSTAELVEHVIASGT